MTNVQAARENLGARLRELRRDAGLDGRQLAIATGWHPAKVSKIEHGKQTPSEDDIRTWCANTHAELHVTDLIASVRNINAAWMEWKRIVGPGHARHQNRIVELEDRTELLRGFDPLVLHGLLQTEEYARAILTACIEFLGATDDIDRAVAARMHRQQVLYHGRHRFNLLIGQQALLTSVGNDAVMIGQMEHLLDLMSLSRLVLGVVPATSGFIYRTTDFVIYDRSRVLVETITAESTITQPREIALYENAFHALAAQALYGASARALVIAELDRLRGRPASDGGDA